MLVPRDRSLASWIRELEALGRIYRFYKTDEWLDLRDAILDEQHHECERCKERGKYSRAVVVHHVCEVRDRPELALSRFYVDSEGRIRRQLIALCFRCHNEVHERFGAARHLAPITEERW